MRDSSVIDMGNGYTLQLNWSSYPSAVLIRGESEVIGRKDWMMTGWNLPGPFSIHARIRRWALKTMRRYEDLEHDLGGQR